MTAAGRGKGWEARLNAFHEAYRRQRRALVFQAHPPAGLRAKAPPDFFGVCRGRSLLFDAKSTRVNRLDFGRIANHQAVDLEAHHQHGGLSFIALDLGARSFVVPWGSLSPLWWGWRERVSRQASVNRNWLWRFGVEMGPDGWIDWAEGVCK